MELLGVFCQQKSRVDVEFTPGLSFNATRFGIFSLFYNLHSLSYNINHLRINPLRCSDAENTSDSLQAATRGC